MQTYDRHNRLVVNGRVTVGEVRSRGEYVIGYGSHHKSGRDYELVVDAPLFPNPIPADVKVVSNTPAIGTDQQNEIASYVEEALDKSKIEYTARQDYQGGFKWLVTCPWEHEHTCGKTLEDGGSSSAAFMLPSGALVYRCLHAHCQSSRDWKQLREYMESVAGHKLPFGPNGQLKPSYASETFGESGTSTTPPQVIHPIEERPDISRGVLSGRLGEICEREMLDDFPVSYAWLSLITAASVLVPERPSTGNGDNLHNLYTALVGPVNCGKSQAIEWAMQLLRIQDDLKRYDEVKPGSAERLLRYMNYRASHDDLGPRVLMSLDEWKFFFDKAAIENSVFPTLLTTGFYRRNTTILDSHGRPLTVPASFSWIGGIVTDSYDDCLSQVTSLGLHDRLLQGINPSNYSGFDYRPFEGKTLPADFVPQHVQIDKSVWECLKAWRGANPQATREAEIAFRVAEICASFDGAPILYGKDLGPHLILADEQMKLRATLKPNTGETPDAKCAIKVENYLTAHGSAGEWVDFRAMMKAIHYEKFGPNIFKRTIDGLVYLKIVEIGERPAVAGKHAGGHPAKAIRRVLD
jgi:hypothetical protein